MSHQAVDHVLKHSPSRGAARLVELVLGVHAGPDGTNSWPSASTIARQANLSERAVREALATLRAGGLIVDTGESPKRTRTYRVAHAVYGAEKGADGAGVQTAQGADGAGGRVQTAPGEGADGAPKAKAEPSLKRTAAARATPNDLLDDVLRRLNGAGRIDRSKLADLIAEHPGKDHRAAADDVAAWAKRQGKPLHSTLGAYRSALDRLPDPPPPPPQPDPPTDEARDAWAAARDRLHARTGSNFDIWLEPLRLLGQDGDQLILGSPPELAAWVRDGYSAAIGSALGGRPYRIDALPQAVTA